MPQILEFAVREQQIYRVTPCSRPVVAESKQHVYASFYLDDEWDNMTVTAVFSNDNTEPYEKIITADPVEVPPEVLVEGRIRVSLVGLGPDGKQLTTKRMEKPIIVHCAGDLIGLTPEEASPELWEQVLSVIGNLAELETLDKSSLVAAINEAARSGGGGGTVEIDKIDPSKVVFPEDVLTTYEVGKIKLENGSATLIKKGETLRDFFNVFMDEKNPDITGPTVSLTFSQAKAYEVGTKVTPSYGAVLNPGSYSYGPDTGIVATAWEVTDTNGNKKTTASGSFPQIQVVDNLSYKITAKATHGAGAVPVTNAGNPYEAGKIAAGSKSATSGAMTGYRNTFYGTTTNKNALTSGTIRGLTKSGRSLANGSSFNVSIPVGALRVVIAYPATLRDLTSVKDVNGMNAQIVSSFVKQTISVYGENNYTAISYKVYTLEFASANDKANTYAVTI